MARLGRHSFNDPEGNLYEIDLDLEYGPLDWDGFDTVLRASRTDAVTGKVERVECTVRLNAADALIEVRLHEKLIATIPLGSFNVEGAADPDDDLIDSADLLRTIFNAPEGLEAAIDALPVEPGLGCLVKAGVSTTVGQIIACNGRMAANLKGKRKVLQILRCLGVNSHVMLAKITWRTLRCIAFLGN